MRTRRSFLGLGAGTVVAVALPLPALAADGSWDISYLWSRTLDSALDYRELVAAALGPEIARDLVVVRGGSGNWGLILDRTDTDAAAAKRLAADHHQRLRAALGGDEVLATPLPDRGYRRTHHVGYGTVDSEQAARDRCDRIIEKLGAEVRTALVVEAASPDRWQVVYKRFADEASTASLAAQHAKVLAADGIPATALPDRYLPARWAAGSEVEAPAVASVEPPAAPKEVAAKEAPKEVAPKEVAAKEVAAKEPAAKEVVAKEAPKEVAASAPPAEAAKEPAASPAKQAVPEPSRTSMIAVAAMGTLAPLATSSRNRPPPQSQKPAPTPAPTPAPPEPAPAAPAAAAKAPSKPAPPRTTVALPPSSPELPAAIATPLRDAINGHIQGLRKQGIIDGDETTSWYVHTLHDDRTWAAINAEQSLQCASMVKPYIALAFLHKVGEGRIVYGKTSRAKLEAMIHESDNAAANWTMEQVGGPAAVQRVLTSHYGNVLRETSITEAIPRDGRTYKNRSSARDYVRFSRALWRDQLAGSAEIKRLMSLPGRDRLFTGAPDIPPGTAVMNKTGTTSHLCGDFGILVARSKTGGKMPYAIVGIIEKRHPARSFSTWVASRSAVIRGVSNLVYRVLGEHYELV